MAAVRLRAAYERQERSVNVRKRKVLQGVESSPVDGLIVSFFILYEF